MRIEHLCQFICILYRIIFAGNECVFKGNFAPRACKICTAGIQQLSNAPTVVNGHNGRARFIVGRVKRDRERDGKILLHQHFNAVNKSAGRKRNVAVANVEPCLTVYKVQKLDNVIIVIQRLTNAHHNNVGNALTNVLLSGNYLPKQLCGSQVAHATANGRGAELAPHTAANLRGNANGVAVLVFHNNAFHAVTVGKTEQKLDCAINGRHKLLLCYGKVIVEGCAQFFLQLFADVCHFIRRDTAMKLLKNLLCTVFCLTVFYHPSFKLGNALG